MKIVKRGMASVFILSNFFLSGYLHAQLGTNYVSIYKVDGSGNRVPKSVTEVESELERSAISNKTYFSSHAVTNDNSGSRDLKEREDEEMKNEAAQELYHKVLEQNCFLHLDSSNGFAALKNYSGKIILSGNYDYAKELVEKNGQPSSWIIGKNGKYSLYGRNDTIMEFKVSDFNWINRVYHDWQGIDYFLITGPDNKFGLLECSSSEMRGDMMIPIQFDSIGLQWYDIIRKIPVKSNGKWGIWDCYSKNLVAPCIYDSISINQTGVYNTWNTFFIKHNNKWGVYDATKGIEIISADYDKIASCKYSLSGYTLDDSSGTYSLSNEFPSFIGIRNGQKVYFNQQFAIYIPKEIPSSFEQFVLPGWEYVSVPDEKKPHKRNEWHSIKKIDDFFSFDKMEGTIIDTMK